MAGKISKLAAGIMMTHWTRSKVDNALLAEITLEAGGSSNLVEEVKGANTARHAYELWRAAHLHRAANLLCEQAAENIAEYAEDKLEVHVVLVDFDTLEPAGASPGALALTAWSPA
jgi:cobalt-precorrin-5B (C1)-methyltransferase